MIRCQGYRIQEILPDDIQYVLSFVACSTGRTTHTYKDHDEGVEESFDIWCTIMLSLYLTTLSGKTPNLSS